MLDIITDAEETADFSCGITNVPIGHYNTNIPGTEDYYGNNSFTVFSYRGS